MPLVGFPVSRPVGGGHEGARPPLNIVPTAKTAPEGATRQHCGKAKQYPPAVWRCDADGKLERIAMHVV
jgi:hypothetical protein